MRSVSTITIFMWIVGAMDAATGVLLMLAPTTALSLMGVDGHPVEPVFLRFIGAFVAGLGVTYFLPMLRITQALDVLASTAVIRAFVGAFVALALLLGTLEPAWITVAGTDVSIASVQIAWLVRYRSRHG